MMVILFIVLLLQVTVDYWQINPQLVTTFMSAQRCATSVPFEEETNYSALTKETFSMSVIPSQPITWECGMSTS